MISMARAIARMVIGSFASPVPFNPTTSPIPRKTFSSWPFTRHIFFSRVAPIAHWVNIPKAQQQMKSVLTIGF
jgi:hypothetical protein